MNLSYNRRFTLPERSDGLNVVDLMEKYRITLPKNAIEWRAKGGVGKIPSLHLRCAMLCTDGVVAWFLLEDQTTVFQGHLLNFVLNEEEKEKTKRALSAKAKALAAAIEED